MSRETCETQRIAKTPSPLPGSNSEDGPPRCVEFQACISNIPEGMTLADLGPKAYLPTPEDVESDFKVLSDERMTLKNGTEAYRTQSEWLYGDGKTWTTTLPFRRSRMVNGSAFPQARGEIRLRTLGSLRV
jgi:hypothetical protein